MPLSLTIKLLQNHYRVVLGLRDYLSQICGPEIVLAQVDDTKSYTSLVETSYVAFDEPLDASMEVKFKAGECMSEMYEVVDRVQVRLFERAKGKPLNILTMGYRHWNLKADHRGEHGRADMSRQAITNFFPNTNITALQSLEWEMLLTRIGEVAMYHLLLNTSIFVALPNNSFCQLAGTPITHIQPHASGFCWIEARNSEDDPVPKGEKRLAEESGRVSKRRRLHKSAADAKDPPGIDMKASKNKTVPSKLTPVDIPFVRLRMFYRRPIMIKDPKSGKRCMAVGLPPNNVLHRLAPVVLLSNGDVPPQENIVGRDARHVLKYIFPRQFGLRSPFDANQDRQGYPSTFEDYTIREEEIRLRGNIKTPKRLKSALHLVHQLIKRHWALNYRGVCSLFCPSKLKKIKLARRKTLDDAIILEIMAESSHNLDVPLTQAPMNSYSMDSHSSLSSKQVSSTSKQAIKSKPKFTEFICTHNEVFRFVLKVTEAVIPKEFWGCRKNFNGIMKHVKQCIKGRRFETITLHAVLQKFSTQECEWLLPQKAVACNQRPSVTDAIKRRELVEDFLYWYFNSFVIPLISTTFYVTESNRFRHRVLYFRQDDWTGLCRPLLNHLAEGMFEKLDVDEAQHILHQRKLGFSFVRLLPKETGVRPIVNLRRKSSKQQPGSSSALSINQVLQAAFQILTYEKNIQANLLGASVFGLNEIYAKLKTLKTRLLKGHGRIPKLFFLKVDVRTCFDSIDQGKLLDILQKILSEDGYMIQKFSHVLPMAGKIRRTFWRRACPEADHPHFLTLATKLAEVLRHAIFVDQVVYSYEDRQEVMQLLKEHVTENIVKIGRNYYRQTVGIPQGSVLSSILCSFFYGDLETKQLGFTTEPGNVLCRLVDDYLFITANESTAKRFLDIMNAGHPEYGCFISADKTLTSFYVDECTKQTFPGQTHFPWCGLLINMNDLSVSVDYARYEGTHIGDTLTVERGRNPGIAFEYKMLRMARYRSHEIFCDTTLNPEQVVYQNIYENFLLAGMKMYRYVCDWGIDLGKKSVTRFLINVMHKMIRWTYMAVRSKLLSRTARTQDVKCAIKEASVVWLGTHAFWSALKRKGNAKFGAVMMMLEHELRSTKFTKCQRRWVKMVKEANILLEKLRY